MKFTKTDYERFVEECKYWADALGLQGYDIDYKFCELKGEHQGCFAVVTMDTESRTATITLNTDNIKTIKNKDYEIRNTAYHEIMEIVFNQFVDVIKQGIMVTAFGDVFKSPIGVNGETHSLINKIWRIIEGTDNNVNKEK